MQAQDITAPSSRQSLAAVIIVAVFAGVIVTRSSMPRQANAEPASMHQSQQNNEQSELLFGSSEVSIKNMDEIKP